MKTYTFIIKRVYSTLVEVEATTKKEALQQLHEMDINSIEREQSCVVESVVIDQLGNRIEY